MKAYFKTSTIATGVALAIGAASLPLPSQAVSLSDNNLGGTAIVPFYSTRGNDTYISIVNTDPDYAIAVKLRFREADNSRDARDFNIVLSPNDVWTAVVTVNAEGVPLVQSNDESCTAPGLLESEATNPGMKGITFTAIDYNGGTTLGRDARSDEDVQLDRTEDGHFEVIQMGAMLPQLEPGNASERNIAGYATHDSGYFDCGVVSAAMSRINTTVSGMGWTADQQFNNGPNADGDTPPQCALGTGLADCGSPPRDVMQVAANMIDVDAGVAAMIPVTMLQLFSDTVQLFPPGDQSPNLNNATPPTTNQILDGVPFTSTFTYGVDAVSSLMMATEVLNQYAVGGAAEADNDWVVTFPTKNFYVDGPLQLAATISVPVPWDVVEDDARPPFTDLWVGLDDEGDPEPGNGLSCEGVAFNYFDREENPPTGTEIPDFSPTPIGSPGDSLCYETQTLQFGADPVLNGRNNYGVPLEDGFTSGWMRLAFTGSIANTTGLVGSGGTQLGLPVLSFGVKSYTNGVTDARGILNYGFTQPAAFKRELTTP